MRNPEDLRPAGHGPDFLPFPRTLDSRESQDLRERVEREQERRLSWQIELEALDRAIKTGTYIVKPGHRVGGVPGTGEDQKQPIKAHYSRSQLERRSEKREILTAKLSRRKPPRFVPSVI